MIFKKDVSVCAISCYDEKAIQTEWFQKNVFVQTRLKHFERGMQTFDIVEDSLKLQENTSEPKTKIKKKNMSKNLLNFSSKVTNKSILLPSIDFRKNDQNKNPQKTDYSYLFKSSDGSAESVLEDFPQELAGLAFASLSKQSVLKVVPKMDDFSVKMLNLHRIHCLSKKVESDFISNGRLIAIADYCIRRILLENDMREIPLICYEHFLCNKIKNEQAITATNDILNFCLKKKNSCRTRVDVFMTLIPSKPLNNIELFKAFFLDMHSSLDDLFIEKRQIHLHKSRFAQTL